MKNKIFQSMLFVYSTNLINAIETTFVCFSRHIFAVAIKISNIEKEKLAFRKLNEHDRELFVNLRFEYFLIDGFDINESNKNKIAPIAYLTVNKIHLIHKFIDGKIAR